MDSSKICIISCGIGGWYPQGIERMKRSLLYHGYGGALMLRTQGYPPHSPTHKENPYAFKVYAIMEAIDRGFTHLLWLDASIWAVQNPMAAFDYINEHGILLFKTGFNCAQSCNDRILEFAGVTRDEAEQMPEYATGMIGLNWENDEVKDIFSHWTEYAHQGMFKGSRLHDNQSEDPRFLHHRQDQSAMSLIINRKWYSMEQSNLISYYPAPEDANRIFFIQGM